MSDNTEMTDKRQFKDIVCIMHGDPVCEACTSSDVLGPSKRQVAA